MIELKELKVNSLYKRTDVPHDEFYLVLEINISENQLLLSEIVCLKDKEIVRFPCTLNVKFLFEEIT